MRRGASVLALLLLACGGEAPIPPEDYLLQVGVDADVVEVGEAFGLEVSRVWRKDLSPPAWDDALLSPLVVRLTSSHHREDGERVEEIRRYRAYAFTLDPVVVAPITQAATGADRRIRVVARSEPIHLGVMGVLDPDRPGEPELPGPLLPAGPPGRSPLLAALLVLAFLAVAATRGRAPSPPPAPPPAPPPSEGLLARLEALRRAEPSDPEAARRQVDALSELIRTHVASAHGIAAGERTSEEILDALDPAARRRLAGVLPAIDAVRFGGVPVARPAMLSWIAAVETGAREDGA